MQIKQMSETSAMYLPFNARDGESNNIEALQQIQLLLEFDINNSLNCV